MVEVHPPPGYPHSPPSGGGGHVAEAAIAPTSARTAEPVGVLTKVRTTPSCDSGVGVTPIVTTSALSSTESMPAFTGVSPGVGFDLIHASASPIDIPSMLQYPIVVIVGAHTHPWYEISNSGDGLFSDHTAPGGVGVLFNHASARCCASVSSEGEADGADDGALPGGEVAVDVGAAIGVEAHPLTAMPSVATPISRIPPRVLMTSG